MQYFCKSSVALDDDFDGGRIGNLENSIVVLRDFSRSHLGPLATSCSVGFTEPVQWCVVSYTVEIALPQSML